MSANTIALPINIAETIADHLRDVGSAMTSNAKHHEKTGDIHAQIYYASRAIEARILCDRLASLLKEASA